MSVTIRKIDKQEILIEIYSIKYLIASERYQRNFKQSGKTTEFREEFCKSTLIKAIRFYEKYCSTHFGSMK